MGTRKKDELKAEESGRPTIWDVAKRSGVSIATVSRVLNGQQLYITSETKDRVLHAVQELGYVSPRRSKEIVNDHEFLVGLTFISVHTESFGSIVGGVIEALHARNARPVICPIPRRHNCNMSLRERLMSSVTTGGLIVGSTERDEELLDVIQHGFPCVVIVPEVQMNEKIPVVAAANWSGMRSATEHLIELGHARIALIRYRHTLYTNRERFAGFQAAMFEAELPVPTEYLYETDGESKEAGYSACKYFLSLPEPPTAIAAHNDTMAMGVLQAAHEMGKVVPRDLSIVGYDDTLSASIATPQLTTVRQQFMEMGRMGVEMLLRQIEGRPLDVARVELSTRLIVRDSTAPPADAYNHRVRKKHSL